MQNLSFEEVKALYERYVICPSLTPSQEVHSWENICLSSF